MVALDLSLNAIMTAQDMDEAQWTALHITYRLCVVQPLSVLFRRLDDSTLQRLSAKTCIRRLLRFQSAF